MFRHLVQISILVIVAQVNSSHINSIGNEIVPDQDLIFSIAVNRHGERAPDADELSLSDQQELIRNLTYLEGPEGLMLMGKRKAYQLGKFYRHRYGAEGLRLISNLYMRDEIAIRSTDKERTKMTIQVAMAAAYPPEVDQQWDEGVGKVWQPVPYTSVPLSEDYLRYYSNCRKYMGLMKEAQHASISEELAPFMDLIPLLKEKTGTNFTENPLMFQSLIDLFRSTIGLGLKLPEWSKPHLDRLGEAARLAYRLYFRGEEMKKIGGGVLLDMFIEAADKLMAGQAVPQRLRLFSAHDFNLGALMEVARVKGAEGIPDYGSVFALELYRSRSSGYYSVLPVYLPSAGSSSIKELRITGCENYMYCDFTKFRQLVKGYRLPEKEYYKLCNIKTEM